jgi:two-component sensor histidine kinase/CheY-like chemotaxis protein
MLLRKTPADTDGRRISRTLGAMLHSVVQWIKQATQRFPVFAVHGVPSVREWLLLVVATGVLPALAFTCWLVYVDYTRLRSATISQLTGVSGALSQVLEGELQGWSDVLVVLVDDPSLQSDNLAGFDQRAHASLKVLPPGSAILLTDPTGREFVNTNITFGTPLPRASDVGSLQQVVRRNSIWISDLFVGAVQHRPMIGIYAPVRRDDGIVYILGLGVPAEAIAGILRMQQLPQGSIAGILDRNGVIAARTKDPDMWVGKQASPRLRELMRQTASGITESQNLDGVGMITAWDRSPRTGWTVVLGQPAATLTSTLFQSYLFIALAGVLALGSGVAIAALLAARIIRSMAALSHRAVAVGAGGSPSFSPSGIREIDDVNHALTLAAVLISERVKQRDSAEEQQRLLMAEIDHRGKNILANVQAIANQTLPNTPQTKSFGERLLALARVHNLLAQSHWRGASLMTLLDSTLQAYRATATEQITIRGDDALLRPSAAQALSLILNELATNANKYGALARSSGRLNVEIKRFRDTNNVVIHWIEWNPQPIQAPSQKGLGSILIERLARELPGKVDREYHKNGLECCITLSLSEFSPAAEAVPVLPKHHVAESGRENVEVMIVEDSALAGHELCSIVSEAGFEAIGPATSVDEAMQIVTKNKISFAILDVNLIGETVFPVAYALRERAIPFVFVTGYSDDYAYPSDLRSVRKLRKPVQAFPLLDAMSAAILGSSAVGART